MRLTFGYLKSIPQREIIQKRMTELWNYEKIGAPFKRGGRYYFFRNDGLQNQNVLYQQILRVNQKSCCDLNAAGPKMEPLPCPFSDDDDVAYGVQEAGSDWNTWKIGNRNRQST